MNRREAQMQKTKLLAGLLAVCLSSGAVQAQQTTSAAGDKILPEKVALIKQLLELTSPRKTIDAMLKAQADEMEKRLPEMTWQSVATMSEFKSLTPAEREQLHDQVMAGARDLNRRIFEMINQKIDFGKAIEDLSLPLYDKFSLNRS